MFLFYNYFSFKPSFLKKIGAKKHFLLQNIGDVESALCTVGISCSFYQIYKSETEFMDSFKISRFRVIVRIDKIKICRLFCQNDVYQRKCVAKIDYYYFFVFKVAKKTMSKSLTYCRLKP